MAKSNLHRSITERFRRGEWAAARELLQQECEKHAQDHWLLTQIAVTHYEEQDYKKAIQILLQSYAIVPDCPLTLWNLAGAFDAVGDHSKALAIYTWLLRSDKSPADDSCWESRRWTDSLKADCVYRIAVCLQNLGNKEKAKDCFRQYFNLLSVGVEGTYSFDDVTRKMRQLQANNGQHSRSQTTRVRRVIDDAFRDVGQKSGMERRKRPPLLDELREASELRKGRSYKKRRQLLCDTSGPESHASPKS